MKNLRQLILFTVAIALPLIGNVSIARADMEQFTVSEIILVDENGQDDSLVAPFGSLVAPFGTLTANGDGTSKLVAPFGTFRDSDQDGLVAPFGTLIPVGDGTYHLVAPFGSLVAPFGS